MGKFLIYLLAGLSVGGALFAQPLSPTSALPPGIGARRLPPQPVYRTPVDLFRELLAMKPAEREKALASRTNQVRVFLQGKIKEFEALPDAIREERLQTLQLRWHLVPLMKLPPSARGTRLATLAEADRKLVEERLEQWDHLPGELQRKVLENENVIRLFFRSETNAPRSDITQTNLSPAQRAQMEQEQLRWQAMSDEERQRILTHFERFFTLNAREKARILKDMGGAERRQMEMALQQFSRLPKPQREVCLRGFQKFAALTPQEREEFLSNAERWEAMSPNDRRLWRDLVNRLQPKPPMPPTFRSKLPPMPPGITPKPALPPKPAARPTQVLTTN
jgi:hypothetical protein